MCFCGPTPLGPHRHKLSFLDANRDAIAARTARAVYAGPQITRLQAPSNVIKAAEEFKDKTTRPTSSGRLTSPISRSPAGPVLSLHRARRLLALHCRLEALRDYESAGCHRHTRSGVGGVRARSDQRRSPATASVRQRLVVCRERSCRLAGQAEHRACPRSAVSSADPGQNRALASNAQEPNPA
jgi:hypothetical protein